MKPRGHQSKVGLQGRVGWRYCQPECSGRGQRTRHLTGLSHTHCHEASWRFLLLFRRGARLLHKCEVNVQGFAYSTNVKRTCRASLTPQTCSECADLRLLHRSDAAGGSGGGVPPGCKKVRSFKFFPPKRRSMQTLQLFDITPQSGPYLFSNFKWVKSGVHRRGVLASCLGLGLVWTAQAVSYTHLTLPTTPYV